MNYIELINQFWQTRRSKRITSLQSDLYFFLIHECNTRGWENPFEVSNRLICASIGISEPSLIDARNRLRQIGLIDFHGGKRNAQSPIYYLNSNLNNLSRNRATSLVESLVETELLAEPDINKTKHTSLPPLPPKKNGKREKCLGEMLELPFHGDRFRDGWMKLISTKKWKGKSSDALSLSLRKLAKYEEEFACQLVEDAMEKGWQGVVYEDTDDKYEKWKIKRRNGKQNLHEPKVSGTKIWTPEELSGEVYTR